MKEGSLPRRLRTMGNPARACPAWLIGRSTLHTRGASDKRGEISYKTTSTFKLILLSSRSTAGWVNRFIVSTSARKMKEGRSFMRTLYPP